MQFRSKQHERAYRLVAGQVRDWLHQHGAGIDPKLHPGMVNGIAKRVAGEIVAALQKSGDGRSMDGSLSCACSVAEGVGTIVVPSLREGCGSRSVPLPMPSRY